MEYFYWLRVKSSNHLHTELSHGYQKDTKFYLESKASFIDISSLASFKPFLITWLWEYCTLLDSSVVNMKSSPWPKYSLYEAKIVSYYQTFFLFKYVLHQTVLSKCLKKKIGDHRARLREKENLFRYRAQFEGNLSRFARARTHVHALMTQKSCAVEMRNGILRNCLKSAKVELTSGNFVQPKQHVQWLMLGFPRLQRQISRNFWRTKTQKMQKEALKLENKFGKISCWKKC